MRIARELLAVAKSLAVESEFPVATFYHGTFLINLKPILSKGLSPRIVDAKSVVDRAVEEIASDMGMTKEQKVQLAKSPFIKSAVERVSEGKVKHVSVSGEYSYAKGHTGASSEWYHEIIHAAQRILYADYYEQEHTYIRKVHDAWDEMKKLDGELKSLSMEEEDWPRREEIFEEQRKLNELVRAVEEEKKAVLSGMQRKIDQQEVAVLRGRFGDEGVLLTLSIPWADLKSLAADSYTKKRLEKFEEQFADWKEGKDGTWVGHVGGDKRRVWGFFREIHLKKVPPKFITKWKKVG